MTRFWPSPSHIRPRVVHGKAAKRLSLDLHPRLFSSSELELKPVNLEYYELIPANSNKADKPLVILHGLFGSKRNWTSLSKAFMRDLNRPVYALDLRNQGSSPHTEPMTYVHMAADVLHFCQKHSLSDISLLGHSMGGKVAMAVALSPELPKGVLSNLIVADIAPSKSDLSPEFRGYLKGMKRIAESNVSTRKEAQEILAEYENDPGVRAFLLTNLTLPGPRNRYAQFRVPLDFIDDAISDLGSFPYEPDERTWDGRTLIIKGTKSRYVNRHNIPLAKQFFPNMVLETLEAGHWVHAESPTEFKKLVTEFINPLRT